MSTLSENHNLPQQPTLCQGRDLLEAEDRAVVSGCPSVHCTNPGGAVHIDCDMSGALLELDNVSSLPEHHQGAPYL